MAFNPLKLFNRQQPVPPAGAEVNVMADSATTDGANERGSATFNDVQTFRPEIEDEVVVQNMLNNKYPENMKHELLGQDGHPGPEVLSLDKSSPKLAEAVSSPSDGTAGETARYENMLVAEVAAPTSPQQAQDVFITEFTGSDEQMQELVSRLQQRGLIDTSTGEIVWADEATSNFTGSDEELGALVAWLQEKNLVDTSSGSVVWNGETQLDPEVLSLDKSTPKLDMAVAPEPNADGILPHVEQQPYHGGGEATQDVFVTEAVGNDGSPLGRDQVFVGGFGGGPGDELVSGAAQPSGYFEDSVRTAREAAATEPPTEEVGFVFHATDGEPPAAESSALHGHGTVSGVLSGHSGGWNVAPDSDGDARDTIGESTLLDARASTESTESFSLNFEEVRSSMPDDLDSDVDGGDAGIELPD